LQGNWQLGTTTVVYLTKKNGLLASNSRMGTFEGAHFIASAPGRRKP